MVRVSWHLSPSEQRISQIPPPSLCVCTCIPPIVVRQRFGKHVPAATNTRNNRGIAGCVVFYAVLVLL
jgi:hypothetical protein